ncbi:hypothetical protein [Rhodophyticola porphyridii]|uniref:Uncharacterized protein n=1 Tax=Rhodophyticola porphyridii TaxID=1852017 RepID=A0A3L9XYI5_9RHOB|nr:hypothetical protein [Rhodophyticola porphyridii]RMA41584.1 hypothetical protein D9R08_14910 [Rhodophyticola porphyridii]
MPGPKQQTPFTASLGNITWVIAILITFVALPYAYGLTLDWVIGVAMVYSAATGFTSTIGLIWLFLLGMLIYSVVRGALSAALSALGLFIILRLSGRE